MRENQQLLEKIPTTDSTPYDHVLLHIYKVHREAFAENASKKL